MNILIATGGTGGHIFPAIETAKALKVRGHHVSFAGVLGLARPLRGRRTSQNACGDGRGNPRRHGRSRRVALRS